MSATSLETQRSLDDRMAPHPAPLRLPSVLAWAPQSSNWVCSSRLRNCLDAQLEHDVRLRRVRALTAQDELPLAAATRRTLRKPEPFLAKFESAGSQVFTQHVTCHLRRDKPVSLLKQQSYRLGWIEIHQAQGPSTLLLESPTAEVIIGMYPARKLAFSDAERDHRVILPGYDNGSLKPGSGLVSVGLRNLSGSERSLRE